MPLPDIINGETPAKPPQGRKRNLPAVLGAGHTGDENLLEDYNALKELFSTGKDPEDILSRTDVTAIQIIAMSRGWVFADRFDSKELKNFIRRILILSMSKNRKSRKEFVEGFRSAMTPDGEVGSAMANMVNNLRR